MYKNLWRHFRGFLIFFGISTFILARDITIGQRQEQMRARKAIQQQVKEELTSKSNWTLSTYFNIFILFPCLDYINFLTEENGRSTRINRSRCRQVETCSGSGNWNDDRHVLTIDVRLPQKMCATQIPRGYNFWH